MTGQTVVPPPMHSQSHRPSPRSASTLTRIVGPWSGLRVAVVVVALLGVAVLLYPSAAPWFAARSHDATVTGYVRTVEAMTPVQMKQELAAAHAYNEHLPTGPLHDPYTATDQPAGEAYGSYLHTLDMDPHGVLGYVTAPEIDLNLPIYHGTAPDTLDRGVGHLYGSALPVGGAGTHSVLTGHSGVVGSTLFTHIDDLRLGDEFTVTVLDRTLTYRVDQIRTVLPDETDALRAVPGEDYVTLVTCTPIGVNTHRLLVRGVRVPDAPTGPAGHVVDARAHTAGFPFWALEGVGALALLVLLTRRIGRVGAVERRGVRS